MRHRFGWSRLGRDSKHRRDLLKNMAMSLIKHERIMTTLPKAKELRRTGDMMITLGKKGSPHAKREAWNWMREDGVLVAKLFGPLRDRYMSRPGGYTRVLKAPNRKGDNAPMAVVELVGNRFPPLRPEREARRGGHHSDSTGQSLNTIESPDRTSVENEVGTPV
ncbi:large ribosomal subunit protein bL17-like [Halichondria panicea]|uniref:large ribosomal subunit protein bL17-like n=1 Tax=Halichondria panicea TaxID=6063 RepID=UPI00312BBB37